jgi:hypothetical protein
MLDLRIHRARMNSITSSKLPSGPQHASRRDRSGCRGHDQHQGYFRLGYLRERSSMMGQPVWPKFNFEDRGSY